MKESELIDCEMTYQMKLKKQDGNIGTVHFDRDMKEEVLKHDWEIVYRNGKIFVVKKNTNRTMASVLYGKRMSKNAPQNYVDGDPLNNCLHNLVPNFSEREIYATNGIRSNTSRQRRYAEVVITLDGESRRAIFRPPLSIPASETEAKCMEWRDYVFQDPIFKRKVFESAKPILVK